MKKQWKRFLAIALALTLTVGVLSPAASAEDTQDYAVGDLIEFGSYPQTKVTDETLIAALNAAEQTWKSYEKYTGTTYKDDGTMTPSDFMKFCDVTYEGTVYRGVRFTQYLPFYTSYPPLENLSNQKRNGYDTNTTYWFKWEPLVWRVLDPNAGLLLCERIVDGHTFNDYALLSGKDIYPQYSDGSDDAVWGSAEMTYYSNNYAYSSIRQWLTSEADADSFLNTAFTAAQRESIQLTTLDNSAFDTEHSGYNSPATTDKVFLLSYAEALNPNYGFRDFNGYDNARKAISTDYAKCQGETPKESLYSFWWLRTAQETSNIVCSPGADGWISGTFTNANGRGVRPALRVDLSAVTPHTHSYIETITATCTEGGDTVYVCLCGNRYTGEHMDALGHNFGEWTVTTPATAETAGEESRECNVCHVTETRAISVIPAGYGFFSGGYGTAESPFLIANAVDFDHIDDFYTAYGENLPCSPVYFTQTADIAFFCHSDGDDHLITDGSQGYAYYETEFTNRLARPTPVSVMYNAVYDGGGHRISSADFANFLDSMYAGVFGHVTDSVIRNVTGLLDCVGVFGTAQNGYVGFIAYAENCLLQNIDVRIGNSIDDIRSYTDSPNTGVLAGSATGCRVENCITQLNYFVSIYDAFIGGLRPSYTFTDAWAQIWPNGENSWITARNVTGMIRNDTWAVDIYLDKSQPQQIGIPARMALVDAQGSIVQGSLTGYDPDGTGYLYDIWFTDDIVFAAGANGTLEGAGSYILYGSWSDPINSITGLKPTPDTGYVFDGWTIRTEQEVTLAPDQVLTLQPDGTYTYNAARTHSAIGVYTGDVTVTANFAPHEMHTFDCVQTPPTCTEDGQNVYTCSVCGYTYTQVVDAPGHSFGEWVVTTPATATTEGTETRECSLCHITQTRAISVIPAGYGFFSGGYGTQNEPFLIATAVDFDHIDDFYAACGDNLPCDPVYFTQTADITFFYNDETDNDGTSGYYQVNPYDPINLDPALGAYLCWARPTPVTEMYNAFYDGGGHSLQLIGATNGDPLYIVGDQYVGMFGLVTDSTICDLTVDLGYANGLVGTDSAPSVGGVIGRAENCTLDGITVYVNEYMTLGCDLLAGSAAGCTVTDCFINGACQAPSLIGGANSTYTCSNVWVTGEGACGMPDSALLGSVTGVILADGQGVSTVSVQQMLEEGSESFVLVDTQGVVQQHPVQYDPDATGILFYFYPSETVTVEAGEHGSVIGAGVYQPYSQIFTVSYDAPKIITGLTPVPDTGYVFAGWEFTPPESENAQFTRTMTLQSDGSYTYTSDYFCGNVTVTANFAPHEMHTFDCVQTPATCAEDGQNVYTCTVCGYSCTETVAATGVHDWGEWTVTTPATTTAEGVETRECGVCHTTETRGIPQLPATLAVLSLTVPTEPLYTGDTFTVTVDLTQNSGLAAMSLTLGYDPDILTLTNVQTQGMLATGNAVLSGAINTLPYNILWEDGEAHESHTETGTILTLTFVVKEDAAAGNTAILLAYDADSTFDADLQAVPLTVSGASPTIVRHTPGDADSDGKISLLDVASIARAIAGGWNVQIDARNSDVNGDGVVNLKDVVLLRRFLAGWSVVIV